jgi:hypothetical protein
MRLPEQKRQVFAERYVGWKFHVVR